ncbi:MAG: SAM-dependent methyltransferase [Phenylobacterium sp.]|uniref:SAM-dependent methyltransferase n=1 Tax=Phenylobacterium sp. TaxID=1871053 RepID=UPI00391DB1BC
MSALALAIHAFEGLPAPDFARRAAVDLLVRSAREKLTRADPLVEVRFADEMSRYPVATHTDAANTQHYELPPAFFEQVLGARLKYSCCLYGPGVTDLDGAEEAALAATAAHAEIADGQMILELGCGWGSLGLWLAEQFPSSRVVSVSNSRTQKQFIEARAAARGLRNIAVLTADMNDFDIEVRFDRIVSVEMFEHMANWAELLRRARGWLKDDGRMFVHVFSHLVTPYRFDADDPADWIGRHFFSGGIMPSHGLMRRFSDDFAVEADWRWSGEHYARTARAWLSRFDANAAAIRPILEDVYGPNAELWRRRWRLFFLATEGLFGHAGGQEWGVSHYRLRPL